MTYDAVGFDLLTALLRTWPLWEEIAGSEEAGQRWHSASQRMLRGRDYYPFEQNLRDAAREADLPADRADELIRRWGDFDAWPDTPPTLAGLSGVRLFIVTNCSDDLGQRAAARAGGFELVMTAERAGAYKPDPRPYAAALEALGLRGERVLFVAGSAHDVGGASRLGMDVYWANRGGVAAPSDATALREEPDLRSLLEVLR